MRRMWSKARRRRSRVDVLENASLLFDPRRDIVDHFRRDVAGFLVFLGTAFALANHEEGIQIRVTLESYVLAFVQGFFPASKIIERDLVVSLSLEDQDGSCEFIGFRRRIAA